MHCFKHMTFFERGGCPECKREYEAAQEALQHGAAHLNDKPAEQHDDAHPIPPQQRAT